jgi:hypothetical protein
MREMYRDQRDVLVAAVRRRLGDHPSVYPCDIIIANLTPFGGASADAGTLIEVGWFLGKGKPIFGYSNASESFEQRMRRQLGDGYADLGIEGFHLPDNLMIVGAVSSTPYWFGGEPSDASSILTARRSMRLQRHGTRVSLGA